MFPPVEPFEVKGGEEGNEGCRAHQQDQGEGAMIVVQNRSCEGGHEGAEADIHGADKAERRAREIRPDGERAGVTAWDRETVAEPDNHHWRKQRIDIDHAR